MNTRDWLRLGVFPTLPSLALSAGTLIVVGGVLAETRSQVIAERQRIDQLTEMMAATSRMMRASQEERNADLASRVSAVADAVSARVDSAETRVDELALRIMGIETNRAQLKRSEANAASRAR